jgi:hypothetical protein
VLACVFVIPASSARVAINSALFIVDFLKIKRLTNLEGFCIQQNNFRHFRKIVGSLKSAWDKGLAVI